MCFNLLYVPRTRSWWNYIVPPVMAAVYFVVLVQNFDFSQTVWRVLLWLFSIIGTAVFGFSLNDICDINDDLKAGKPNAMAALSKYLQWFILLVGVAAAILPWFFLNNSTLSWVLFVLQLLLLIIYSVPPVRLKKNMYFSLILDCLYSGLIFIAAILFSQNLSIASMKYPEILLTAAICILLCRGLRNILIHQIVDAENDSKAGLTTFVLKYGIARSLKMINAIIIVEIIGILWFVLLLSMVINTYIVFIIPLFVIYFLLKRYDVKNRNKDKIFYIQILNDFYEDFLPLCFLILLTLNHWQFGILLVFHVVLFQNKVVLLLIEKIFYGIIYRKTLGLINILFKTNL